MRPLTSIFSLLVGVAGWYYLFYSRAAEKLSGIEERRLNFRRRVLRKAGGVVMLGLAVAFFAGFNAVDPEQSARGFVLVWTAVFILLIMIVALAAIDLHLSWRLRRRRTREP